MAEKPDWKAPLRESNATGWIGFLALVLAIGVGIFVFDSVSAPKPGSPSASQAADSPPPVGLK